MSSKRRRLVVGGSCLFAAHLVLGGGVALADALPEVIQAAADGVDEITQTVDETVDEATQTIDEATQTIDEATQTVDEVADEVSQTAGDTLDATGTAVSSVGSGSVSGQGPTGSADPAELGTGMREDREASQPGSGGTTEAGASASGPYDLREPTPAPMLATGPSGVLNPEPGGDAGLSDPCERDVRLVCLGLLYGIGGFADAGAEVLGVLVTTGAGVIALMVLAVALALGGAGALLAASAARAGPAIRTA